jgi:hypothetical protein
MTFDDFTRCGDMKEALRWHLHDRAIDLGRGGIKALADRLGMEECNMSSILSYRIRRQFSLALADRIIANIDDLAS